MCTALATCHLYVYVFGIPTSFSRLQTAKQANGEGEEESGEEADEAGEAREEKGTVTVHHRILSVHYRENTFSFSLILGSQ